jgi:farnesyl-diphosphate farnesyltransferase
MKDLEPLLVRTSRTFALAIPMLGDPLQREVMIAYLLFRIADTFEDASHWPAQRRLDCLEQFAGLVRGARPAGASDVASLAASWVAGRPCDNEGYLELLGETPAVLRELESFSPIRREAIRRHTLRTIDGMAGFVKSGEADGSLRLSNLEDLRQYCYVVAGIVGELLTELFVDVAPSLVSVEGELSRRARDFGEGLQLVNILKDADDDKADGRVYLPSGVDRRDVLALARQDLRAATEYVLALQAGGAPRGLVAFTAFPVLLARATLDRIERSGAGAKIRRDEVMGMMAQLHQHLEAGAPALAQAGCHDGGFAPKPLAGSPGGVG